VPEQSRIVLPAYVSVGRGGPLDYVTVLRHELAHVALHRAVSPAPIPRWFDEGYCRWAARELDFEAAWMLRLAFATGRAPPLDSLELAWPVGGSQARLAYLLSASVIDFLVAESGTYALGRLIERWRATGSFEAALGATYGLSIAQLESQWIAYVKRTYGWGVVLTQSLIFFAMMSAIIVVLYLLRRRRDRGKLAQLRAAEPPAAPAFWSEGGIEIVAHRGYSARAPENTLAAMNRAIEQGAPALEFDIRATRDGVPVVFHDETLERTSTGRGRLADALYSELAQHDAGAWFGQEFRNERIPSLEEVLRSVRQRVHRLYIELKPASFTAEQLRNVVDLIVRYGWEHDVVVMSFDWSLLDTVRSLSNTIELAFLADDRPTFRHAVERAVRDGNALVDCNYRILLAHPELAEQAHAARIDLAVYTVNEVAAANALLQQGVRRLTTNQVERLLKWAAGREA
jgi:glycerophosphoryl diester phosphodiesterase